MLQNQKISIPPPWREFHANTHSSPEFPFSEHKNSPPPLRNFHKFYVTPYLLGKILLERKGVKVKVNTPNA